MNVLLEYIWLDGTLPEPQMRSKIKFSHSEYPEIWYFDGSSTKQATGESSDCVLKPVRTYDHPLYVEFENSKLVLCEVLNADMTPHISNTRHLVQDISDDLWFGFEQEFLLINNITGIPLGHPLIRPQGDYYCGVGANNVAGRDVLMSHSHLCMKAGMNITGINAEVLLGQWEYQLFGKGVGAADDLWVSRYLLNLMCEKFSIRVDYSPKPISGDWNGSGLHTNFSNREMRTTGGEKYFLSIFEKFKENINIHIEQYGSDNHLRLTGKHETAPINEFSWGISDRGSSMRVPQSTAKEWIGYLEDRRPAANADPYRIIKVINDSLNSL